MNKKIIKNKQTNGLKDQINKNRKNMNAPSLQKKKYHQKNKTNRKF